MSIYMAHIVQLESNALNKAYSRTLVYVICNFSPTFCCKLSADVVHKHQVCAVCA